MDKKQEKEKIYCVICEKPIQKSTPWIYDEQEAHMECVLKVCSFICDGCENRFVENDLSEVDCSECGGEYRRITETDKENLRNQR